MLASFRASSAPVLTVEAAASATSRYPSEGASGRLSIYRVSNWICEIRVTSM
jgi:hypothetical protein